MIGSGAMPLGWAGATAATAASLTVLHLVTLRPLTLLVVQSLRVAPALRTVSLRFFAFLTVAASALPSAARPCASPWGRPADATCAASNGTASGTSAASGSASASKASFDLFR